jgi:hypothetical protein
MPGPTEIGWTTLVFILTLHLPTPTPEPPMLLQTKVATSAAMVQVYECEVLWEHLKGNRHALPFYDGYTL